MNTLENVTGNSLYCINSDGAIYKGARLLKPFDNGGYKRIKLLCHGERKSLLVHRLMGYVFLNLKEHLVINHRDGDKANNKLSNLEVCTRSYNTQHAYNNGWISRHRGSKHPMAKLNEKDVRNIRNMLSLGTKPREISVMYSISMTNVYDIKNFKIWLTVL